MSGFLWIQLLFFITVLLCLTVLLGRFMARVLEGQRTFLHSIASPCEQACYRWMNVREDDGMLWTEYLKSLAYFNGIGFLVLFFLQLLQGYLPLNPQNFQAPSLDLAFNAASSFVTNTNWQSYNGESTYSYLIQMAGFTVQNFLSAATGLTVLMVLIRGIVSKAERSLGNFWVDLTRITLYILLPLSIIFSIFLVEEGSIQTLKPYQIVNTLESGEQIIPLGPVASQIAIKQLGTNGGGYFGANSAHPYENPSPITNILEALAILLIPSASVYAFGILVNSKQHGWLLLFVMFFFWSLGLLIASLSESTSTSIAGIYPAMEGKETRLGLFQSVLWSVSTTATANGSVNSMLSSLSPLAGGISLFNIMLGELIFGGVGVGLCTMIIFVLLTVFLAGLMVGRTPEYHGKKIEKREMQWVIMAILVPSALALVGAGITISLPKTISGIGNSGPHGLTEVLYAFASAAHNNGSAFASLKTNIPYYNIVLGVIMLLGRMAIIVPSLAIAGLLAKKNITPHSVGSFSTQNAVFIILLICVIFIVGVLANFPALALGPIAEHLLMADKRSF